MLDSNLKITFSSIKHIFASKKIYAIVANFMFLAGTPVLEPNLRFNPSKQF